MVISASLQACGVVFPFAMLTSICRSIVTICSGLYLLIGMTCFSSKWILSHSTWYKFCRSRHLYRDSLFTGVHYGRFDYQRLIQSLCLIEDPDGGGNLIMAIEHGGLHALEAMVLARYFMFTQVYFHKIRRAYDHHLLDFLKKHVKKYPASLKEYVKWDDNVIFSLLREHLQEDDARRILTRDPFVQAFTDRKSTRLNSSHLGI